MEINRSNYLAWWMYNYARRYGPQGWSKNGERTGIFWDLHPELQGEQKVPLLTVECNNEPTYQWLPFIRALNYNCFWQHEPMLDDDVAALRDPMWGDPEDTLSEGKRVSYELVYSRHCAVVDSAMKFASESIRTAFYCPYYGENSMVPTKEWLHSIYEGGGGKVCDMVSLHSHLAPAELENLRVDSIYSALVAENMPGKQLIIGEGGIPAPGPDTVATEFARGKNIAEAFTTFWARNADPRKPIMYFDWQATSSSFVPDGLENARWGITDKAFALRSGAWGMVQVTDLLAGKQFNRRESNVTGSDTVSIFEFQNCAELDSHRIWVAWQTDGSVNPTGTARLPIRTADGAAVSLALSSVNPYVPISAGVDGYCEVPVSKFPVYVLESSDQQLTRPDLVVENVRAEPTPTWPGQRVPLWMTLRNAGTASYPGIQEGRSASGGLFLCQREPGCLDSQSARA
jgi:hypothetical protein